MGDDEIAARISKLGFKPQKENSFNKVLPHADKIDAEALRELDLIKTNLIKCLLAREIKPGFYRWTLRFDTFLKLYGLMFSKEDHISFIKLYLEVLKIENLHTGSITKICSTLGSLLKRRYLISRDELQIDWRLFFDFYMKCREGTKSDAGIVKDRAALEKAITGVVKFCRSYFPASATQEILNECKPYFCPFDQVTMTNYISLLDQMLPINVKEEEIPISYDLWFKDLMDLWNTCLNETYWENAMLSLMSELSFNNMGYIDFDPYIPLMYGRFTRAFQLPVSYKMRVTSKNHTLGVSTIAKWIVGTLNSKTEVSFKHLEQFMGMIKSFLYSANSGRWTTKLKELFNKLSFLLVTRIYIERVRPQDDWQKKVPEDYKLSDADIDRFVLILKPCLDMAMFSRRFSGDLSSCFQNLACLRPNIIVPLTLEKLYASLESVTEPHKFLSAMCSVVEVSRYMVEGAKYDYPEGPTHVIPLLLAVLPGIDPNDFKKCITTFTFIGQLISIVPIINSSEAHLYYDDLTEEEHIICEASARFEDFVIQFIDRLFVWIESCSVAFVRPEQNSSDTIFRGGLEIISEQVMATVIITTLKQCSPEIFTAALKKIFNFISNNIFEIKVAGKMIASFSGCFTRVNPKESLKLFIPYLCDKVESLLNECGNAQAEEHLDGEILYNLLLLSEVVFGRNEIIPYLDRLIKILHVTLHATCVQAMEISVCMLSNLLSTLSTVEPLEKRSASKELSLHVKEFLPIRKWGETVMIKDLELEWYNPGEKEVKTIELLMREFFFPVLEKFNKYSNGELELTRTQLRSSLKIVLAILADVRALLPMWEETPIVFQKSVAPPMAYHTVENEIHKVSMPDGSNIKKTIADTMHKVQKKLLEIDEGDTKSFLAICEVYFNLVSSKVSRIDTEGHLKMLLAMKKSRRNHLLDEKRYLKQLLIERIAVQQSLRTDMSTDPLSETHYQIFLDLFELGVSRYRDVRVHSQTKLLSLINHFPSSQILLLDKFKEILRMNPEENHQAFKGCLYILCTNKSSPIITKSNWQFLSEIWPLVVNSTPSEKPSIINLITSISETVSAYMRVGKIRCVITDETLMNAIRLFEKLPICSEFSKESSEISQKYHDELADEKLGHYKACMDSLLEACNNRNLHWRHHLLAVGFIRDMVGSEVKYDHLVARYFLNGLIDDSILIRKIASKVVLYILIQNKQQFKKIDVDPLKFSDQKEIVQTPGHREDNKWLLYDSTDLPNCESDWNELKYLHRIPEGYYCWRKTIQVYAPPNDQPRFDNDTNSMSLVQKEIYDFFSDESKVSKLIYYFSMEDKKGTDQFHKCRMYIINYLSKLFEDKILDIFLPHVENLAMEKQEASQRCAAEIISGLIRGSKHWTFEKTKKLWSEIIPILQGASQNILQETMVDWELGISLSLNERDSRRCHWLIEFLLDDPLSDPTPFISAFRLRLLVTAICRQPWRNCELNSRLLEYLKKHLSHPFQLVRLKISVALNTIFLRDYLPPGCNFDRNPKIKDFMDECMPTLDWLYNDTLNKIDNNIHCDKLNGKTSDISLKRDEALKLYKTICKFLISTLVCKPNLNTSFEFYRLLPLTCILQSNEVDDEIRPMCMNLMALFAVTLVPPENMSPLLNLIEKNLFCPLWSARFSIAEFLSTFVFHNMAILVANPEWIAKIQSFVMRLLEDSQLEVRENAYTLLSGLLHCNFLPSPDQLLVDFKLKAKTKVKKSKSASTVGTNGNSNLIERHAGILGLCAFISSNPYDVPEFLPEIFGVLGPHLSDPQPIPSTIRKALCDFKRTHQDNWEVHKTQFTEEQLHILRDLAVPPSYYV